MLTPTERAERDRISEKYGFLQAPEDHPIYSEPPSITFSSRTSSFRKQMDSASTASNGKKLTKQINETSGTQRQELISTDPIRHQPSISLTRRINSRSCLPCALVALVCIQ